jgi:UDP-N-acetylmuramoylalanine--D-glutamate ligase
MTQEELHIQRLMPADALRIRGRHNAVNALAALALASAAGCALGPCCTACASTGASRTASSRWHRQRVEYFDDSKGTNVGATVAALQGPGRRAQGGRHPGRRRQGAGLSPLAAPVRAMRARWC